MNNLGPMCPEDSVTHPLSDGSTKCFKNIDTAGDMTWSAARDACKFWNVLAD